MIGKSDKSPQLNFFSIPLVQFINIEHELCLLAQKINWEMGEKEFSACYSKMGAPAVPVRTIVGRVLLKEIADVHYPEAEKITLVMDNFKTHAASSLYEAYPAN